MTRSHPLVEIHYAFWVVLSVPIGFAGTFFLVPGLIPKWGVPLLLISSLLVFYVARLARGQSGAWLAGVIGHAGLLVAALYYLPRWPLLIGVPLALANLYSLAILLTYRRLWMERAASKR